MKTASGKRILRIELTDNFLKFGDKFEKIDHNPMTGMYCYKRTTSENLIYYEVFKAPIQEGIPRYPKSSEFGFGRALCIRGDEKQTQDKIAWYMSNGFEHGRYGIL